MNQRLLNSAVLAAVLLGIIFTGGVAFAQTSGFTYQGRLTDGGTAANGNYDLQFALFDSLSGGTQIGSTQTLNNVAVSNGVFTVSLDFSASSFTGANRFLDISARPSGAGQFIPLTPRQQVTSTPYAVRSASAANADTATNATQLGGLAASQYVQTNDSRLTDSRPPTPNSSNYVQTNPSSAQSANFNISGNGTVGGTLTGNVVNAATQYTLGGLPMLSSPSNGGNGNLFVGRFAGNNSLPGNENAAFGNFAGVQLSGGIQNAFFGIVAGSSTTSGATNSFFGTSSGRFNTTGSSNSFFGYSAGVGNTGGSLNSFFGREVGTRNTGDQNTFVGASADFTINNAVGDSNTLLGYQTLVSSGVSNGTAIGAHAQVTQSNSLVLGSISGPNPAIADTNVGIGTSAPRSALEVKRNWDGSFGALTVTGDRPTIRFSGGAPASNDQWILHLGSTAGLAPAGSLSFFFGGTAGTSFGSPILSITPSGTVEVTNLGSAGGTQLCRNSSNEISSCSSSLRYKTKIASFRGGLEIINRLRPISFEWKKDHVPDIGLGAEEVEQIEPLLTFRNAKGEIEGVKYNQLSAVFINAFKEQQTQIQEQQARNQEQQRQLNQQQIQIKKQQQQLDAMKKLLCRSHPRAAACK